MVSLSWFFFSILNETFGGWHLHRFVFLRNTLIKHGVGMLTHNAGVWKLRPLPGVVQAVYVSQTQNPVLRQTELFALNNTWVEHNSSTERCQFCI